MKIIFDIDTESIPEEFRPDNEDGEENLINFLHELIYTNTLEECIESLETLRYNKKLYSELELNKKNLIKETEKTLKEKIQLAELLINSLSLEKD